MDLTLAYAIIAAVGTVSAAIAGAVIGAIFGPQLHKWWFGQ